MRSDGKPAPVARVTGTEFGADQVQDLTTCLARADLEERLQIIRILGQMGDARALAALRERMSPVNKELSQLILSVSALKRRLGVKQVGGSPQRAALFACLRPSLANAGGPI